MAGLVPAIHALIAKATAKKDVDARHKAGHDAEQWCCAAPWTRFAIARAFP